MTEAAFLVRTALACAAGQIALVLLAMRVLG